MALHVMSEAAACLQCKNPMCRKGCPINTNIPEAIRLLRENRLDEAGWMLFENNPLTTVCSLICNHEKQCEGHCIKGIKGTPVHFSVIENYISSYYATQMTHGPVKSNGIKAAIVGSGPAGLTVAIILARYGYDVTIFESKDKIGGVLRYGIPEFRLPKTVLDDIKYRHIDMKNIKFRPNVNVGSAITLDDLFRDGYKAIFVGTGVWKPNALHIKGETLGNVHYGINYLNNPDAFRLGNKLVLIGAGNAAMDVARTALRNGTHDVTCFSLTKKVAASEYEFSYAQLEGVNFEYNLKPIEIKDDGVIFREVTEDEDGKITEVPGSDRKILCDSVIISISQGPETRLLDEDNTIETSKRGTVSVDGSGKTSREGVFASGDITLGAKTVVEAVAQSKIVALSMHQYMQSLVNNEKKENEEQNV